MADDCFSLLEKDKPARSTVTLKIEDIKNSVTNTEYLFLEQIITPVYEIVAAVSTVVRCTSNNY